jgi:hypothetical protein
MVGGEENAVDPVYIQETNQRAHALYTLMSTSLDTWSH